ncbi:adenylate kinase [archaeon]|nr:adenylate kinase [archaeon]
MIYLLTGISGVGKTTVIKNCKAEFTHINFGDMVLGIAKEMELAENRDDLKSIDAETTRKIQRKVVARLKQMPGKVLLDTHLTIESHYGFFPGIPHWMAEELNFKNIILIEAPIEEVQKRRNKDTSIRTREQNTLEEIKTQRDMDRGAAITLSVMTGPPVKIIENVSVEKASNELAELFK